MGIVFFIVLFIVLSIAFQNYEVLSREISLRINLIFAEYRTVGVSTGVWFMLFFALGWILGYIRALSTRVKSSLLQSKIRKLEEKIKQLEEEKTQREKEQNQKDTTFALGEEELKKEQGQPVEKEIQKT